MKATSTSRRRSRSQAAEKSLYDLADKGRAEGGFVPFATSLRHAVEIAAAAHKRQGLLSGVPTGFIDLDGKLGGLHPRT